MYPSKIRWSTVTALLSVMTPLAAQDWLQQVPVSGLPFNVRSHVMGHDVRTGTTMVFSGQDNNSIVRNETFVRTGTAWRQLSLSNVHPLSRMRSDAAFDSAAGGIVMFGGFVYGPTGNARRDDTWIFDGVTESWSQRSPQTKPPARESHSMAYSAQAGGVVLFGGSGGSYLGDTWVYALNPETGLFDWKFITTVGPSPREMTAMAFDSNRGKVVLFGGFNGASIGDTWEFDGQTWSAVATATTPTARHNHAMAFDPTRGAVVMTGGEPSPFDDVWEFDGTDWSLVSPPSQPTGAVQRTQHPVVYDHTMIYDTNLNQIVAVGGFDGNGETWVRPAIATTASGAEFSRVGPGGLSNVNTPGSCIYSPGSEPRLRTDELPTQGQWLNISLLTFPVPPAPPTAANLLGMMAVDTQSVSGQGPCLLHVAPAISIPITTADLIAGKWTTFFPANPTWIGVGICMQAVVVNSSNLDVHSSSAICGRFF